MGKKIEEGIFKGMHKNSNMHKNATALVHAIVRRSKMTHMQRRDEAVLEDIKDRVFK